MREVLLTQGKIALVDDSDFERVNQFKWYAHSPKRDYWCAKRNVRKANGKQTSVYMHRFILDVPRESCVDHRDGNSLNNTRGNMRVCNKAQNGWNQRNAMGKSKFKGVSFMPNTTDKKWRAQLCCNGESKYLGCFITEREAAQAYDVAAIKYFGEFAHTNQEMLG